MSEEIYIHILTIDSSLKSSDSDSKISTAISSHPINTIEINNSNFLFSFIFESFNVDIIICLPLSQPNFISKSISFLYRLFP